MKPSIPQGTRDFGPEVVRKRQHIFNTIKTVFELYGFQPLETPAMENLDTLMGKYGEEGDKLIFRILDSGNPFSEEFFQDFFLALKDYNERAKQFMQNQGISSEGPFDLKLLAINPLVFNSFVTEFLESKENPNKYLGKLKNTTSSKALKYDLTIPFARYVAMNHGQLTFPFKRYQIQPVWRADRPQRGRYREFYQCDADIVGSIALINEVEFANIYNDVFNQLGIKDYELRLNSRKILTALAELCGGADKMPDITIAIDKLDKIGLEKVKEELTHRGLTNDQINTIENYLNINGTAEEKLVQAATLFSHSETGQKGIEELRFVLSRATDFEAGENLLTASSSPLTIDFTLARGLNYYTGIIFEAKAPSTVKIGSIGGGGRYDDLTGLFGVPNIPGVGISFGVDRIYDVMEELSLFPEGLEQGTKVLFFNPGEEGLKKAYSLLQRLRKEGISSEIFHEQAKPEKQFKYAEKRGITYVVIMSGKELESGTCIIKNIKTGEQKVIAAENLMETFFTHLG